MRKKITKLDVIRYKNSRRDATKKSIDDVKIKINKIRNSIGTTKVGYPEFKEAFDYVDGLYPDVKVKDVVLYKVTARTLQRYGFGHAGGFCDTIYRTVVFCGTKKKIEKTKYSIRAKVKQDEVIAHELLHYCYFVQGIEVNSSEMKEEFAYGWSLGYLRGKGYSDEEVIKNNYLPYLVETIRNKAFKSVILEKGISASQYNSFSKQKKMRVARSCEKKMYEKSMELAMSKGWELLNMYSKKLLAGPVSTNINDRKSTGFSFIDLD